jgi:hypothetical protein
MLVVGGLILDWREYEEQIQAHFIEEYPSARITSNARLPGRYSGIDRQIDLLVEVQACDLSFRIVVDAKCRSERVDVKDLEGFLGLVGDVRAHKAIMISTEGYTEAAIQRAYADDADVILDVLNFKELARFHAYLAIPYSGPCGALLVAPLGWVVDATQGRHAAAWLYERGLTWEKALESHECMYVNFWHKTEAVYTLEWLFKHQEGYMRENRPNVQIEFIEAVHRAKGKTAIRVVRRPDLPDLVEYTGFVDFDRFIFMCVLLTRRELVEKNLSKLRFVLRKVLPLNIRHEDAGSPVAVSERE